MNHEPLLVPVSPELAEQLSADWSEPVRVKLEPQEDGTPLFVFQSYDVLSVERLQLEDGDVVVVRVHLQRGRERGAAELLLAQAQAAFPDHRVIVVASRAVGTVEAVPERVADRLEKLERLAQAAEEVVVCEHDPVRTAEQNAEFARRAEAFRRALLETWT